MSDLTHFDAEGKAHMVNVGDKPVTDRVAVAQGSITMATDTLARIREGGFGKGDVLGVNAATGDVVGKRALGDPVFVPPVIAQGRMYVLSDDATLYALN